MPSSQIRSAGLWLALAALVVALAIAANDSFARADLRHRAEALTGGSVKRGQELFVGKGCGGCHVLRNVPQATGLVGPPLDGIAERAMIAGMLANSPSNLERWIATPQSVAPGNAMPDMPMTSQQANDIAAFLYTRT